MQKLVRYRFIFNVVQQAIVISDSVILFLRVVGRRFIALGIVGMMPSQRVPRDTPIRYLDLGTHKEADELKIMVEQILPRFSRDVLAFGFEGRADFIKEAQNKLSSNSRVTFVHGALCQKARTGGKVRLYKSDGDGLDSSLYRPDYQGYEEVDAICLSDWIQRNKIDVERAIFLLRMNIEGAEYDVIKDLVESGISRHVDGYYGMWDDLSKIDRRRDIDFRDLLRKAGIHKVTFNGRDLAHAFRVFSIKFDVCTQIRAALRRKFGS